MLGADDPRRVGGRYRSGYWGQEYEVLAFHDFPDWRGRSIAVRWQEPCAVHPPPCVHVHTAMHATAWEWDKDRILFEPSSGK